MGVEGTKNITSPVLLFWVSVPFSGPLRKPAPGLGLIWVMLIVRVVPGVMSAPLPVVEVVIVPKLAKVLFSTVEGPMPVKVSVSVLSPLPKVMVLVLVPLKLPAVEKVMVSARACLWAKAMKVSASRQKKSDLPAVRVPNLLIGDSSLGREYLE